MASGTPFRAVSTATLSVTSSSGTATLNSGASVVEVQNAGSQTAFVRIGASASVGSATTADYPVLPGQSKLISKAPGEDTLAGITASGTTTLYVSSGEGA